MMEILTRIVEQVRQHPKLVAVDDYEVSVSLKSAKAKQYSNGEEDESSHTQSLWVSLRLCHRKQPGRSFVTSASKEALSKLVDSAYSSAERSEVDPWFRFPLWRQIAAQAKAQTGDDEGFDKSLFQELSEPPAVLFESYKTNTEYIGIARKREKQILMRQNTVQEVKFALGAEGDDGPVRLTTERAKRRVTNEKRNWLSEDLGVLVGQKKAQRMVLSPNAPFILGPRVMVQLLKMVKDWFLADRVQSKTSPLTAIDDREPLFSSCLTLIDDGNLPDGAYSVPFDMEGVAAQATKVVDQGRLKSFLYDTYAATKENRLSTGNFFQSKDSSFPEVGPTALYFQKGPGSNLIREIHSGLYLDVVESFEKNDPSRFVASLRGWKITQGSLSHPVSGVQVEIDPLKLLRLAVNTGDDLQFFGRYGSPSILFEKMP